MMPEYGEAYLKNIKEHPEWNLKQHVDALGMPWDKRTQSKLYAFRKSHTAEIAELLGQPIDSDSPEECEKGVKELTAMTDEERKQYKQSCHGYEMCKAKQEKQDAQDTIERLDHALTEANDTIARLEAELAATKALLRDFERANAELHARSEPETMSEADEVKLCLAEYVMRMWRSNR